MQLDLALADYGPEAKGARAQLRQGLGKTIDEIWGFRESDVNFVANNFAAAIQNLRNREATLAALHPSTEAQTQALATEKATVQSIGQSRLQMSFALTSPISIPLIVIVAAWATCLFLGYGLMSGGNAMSFVAVAVGALAVASATYLIFDLSGPYSGIFRASSGRSNKCWRSWAKSDRFAYVVTMSSLQPGVIDRFRPAPPMGSRRRREWFMDVVRLDLDEADHRKRAAIESLGEPADNNEDEAARD